MKILFSKIEIDDYSGMALKVDLSHQHAFKHKQASIIYNHIFVKLQRWIHICKMYTEKLKIIVKNGEGRNKKPRENV